MSILSVDQISPIGSGTTITLNATEVKTGTEITVGTGASIFSPAGNTLTFGTNNVERIRIKNDGKVGINTSNTSNAKLEISDRSTGTFSGLAVGTQYGTSLFGGYNNYPAIMNSNQQPLIYCDTNNDRTELFGDTVGFGTTCAFRVNNAERVRITSDGKIGINNDNPIHAVHIKSVMSSSPSYIHMQATGSNVNGGGGGISFDTSAANTNETKFIATIAGIRNTEGNGSNDLVFSTTKMAVNGGVPTEKLRIGSSGQFGLSGANYGTAGQVLTSQGSGSAVQWASPVIYTEYSSQSISGANSYATTITGNPKIFEVSLYKLRHVASQNIMYRLSTSAGEITSGYHDLSYTVKAGETAVGNAVRGSAQGQGCLTNYNFTNPDNLISGEARFTRVAAGLYTWQAMYDHRFDPSRSGGDANDQYLLNSKGHIADFSSSGSGIVTQFRIFTSGGGNFTSGTVTVRGIA